jgi:hypothetical protein
MRMRAAKPGSILLAGILLQILTQCRPLGAPPFRRTSFENQLVDSKKYPLPKWCGIAGICLAEIYMYFTVAGPRLKSADMPLDSLLIRLGAAALLFGPFGLAVGTGVGLLLDGLRRSLFAPEQSPDDSPRMDPPPGSEPPVGGR